MRYTQRIILILLSVFLIIPPSRLKTKALRLKYFIFTGCLKFCCICLVIRFVVNSRIVLAQSYPEKFIVVLTGLLWILTNIAISQKLLRNEDNSYYSSQTIWTHNRSSAQRALEVYIIFWFVLINFNVYDTMQVFDSQGILVLLELAAFHFLSIRIQLTILLSCLAILEAKRQFDEVNKNLKATCRAEEANKLRCRQNVLLNNIDHIANVYGPVFTLYCFYSMLVALESVDYLFQNIVRQQEIERFASTSYILVLSLVSFLYYHVY